ncbi:MAG: S8 family serine peptidase, partial [Candidatus Coatesbacteria bacterium]|nr:S8 family serine peptidase [Candidatus Coatesbacteria bacterium]
MKRIFISLTILVLVAPISAVMTPFLRAELAETAPDDFIPCYLTLTEQLEPAAAAALTAGLDREEAREVVVRHLRQTAAVEQAALLQRLEELRRAGLVGEVRPFWIVNFIFAELTPTAVEELAQHPDIARLTRGADAPDEWIGLGTPRDQDEDPALRDIAWGVTKIKADEVWSRLGITGAGVILVVADSGQRYTHLDLQDRYLTELSYDFKDDDADPYGDTGSGETHGTFCAGIAASDGDAGTNAGVAPGVTYTAHRVLMSADYQGELSVWTSWQAAAEQGVDVLVNALGWKDAWNPDRYTWQAAARNTLAAGTCLVVAAGNDGPEPETIRCPGDVPEVITVGASDENDDVWVESSRGPSTHYDEEVVKPDVVAPGVDCKSCYASGDFDYQSGWDGTSMAAPHVAGTIALLLQAAPELTPEQVGDLLEANAVDLGPPGKDNTSGAGRIDALETLRALDQLPPHLLLEEIAVLHDDDGDGQLGPGETIELSVGLLNNGNLTAREVQAVLSCADAGVTITKNTADYGDLDGDAAVARGFVFELAWYVSAPDEFTFQLELTADNCEPGEREFNLHIPTATIDDDVENGEWHWRTLGLQDQWHISEQRAHSPEHSWKCGSTNGDGYGDYLDSRLLSPMLYFSPADAVLSFWTSYDLPDDGDVGLVEISKDAVGEEWHTLVSFTGEQDEFVHQSIGLARYAEKPVFLRFRMRTDLGDDGAGWFIDDIRLSGEAFDAGWLAIESEVGEDGVL